jgi:large subunit ribosomal protein L13e
MRGLAFLALQRYFYQRSLVGVMLDPRVLNRCLAMFLSYFRFSQPAQKKARRQKRAAKAAAVAPRPTGGMLRPAVHCPTIKYNSKLRLGRGFSLEELKAAGISAKFAPTIGIAVDSRRFNKSVESMTRNVARLNEYKSKLVLFPKAKLASPGKGEASVAEQAAATQFVGTLMPLAKAKPTTEMAPITDEMKATMNFSTLRKAFITKKLVGTRMKQAKDKAEAEAIKAKEASK